MTTEERLREAIRSRTSEVEPSPPSESLRRIERKLAAARQATVRRRLLVGLSSAAVVLAVVALAVIVSGDGDGDGIRMADDRTTTTASSPSTASSTTTDTSEPSTTTSSSSTTSTTTTSEPTTVPQPPPATDSLDPSVPVWPLTGDTQRFDDPVDAASSFAVDLVGFTDPIVGSFQPGDTARTGEVVVRPVADGPVTRVLVRQLEDDTWWVVASATPEISLDSPVTGAQLTCPLRLTGTAVAFEGTVEVIVRADAATAPLGTGYVTGGGDVPRPFDGTVDCSLDSVPGGAQYGTVILTTTSAEDGRVLQATTRRLTVRAG
jgi:Immunoglobulin-like domain of bacterial spore germination